MVRYDINITMVVNLMRIIAAAEKDMPRIMEIESEAFSFPWTQGGLLSEVNNDHAFFALAVEDDVILGFAILRKTAGEGELLQIAVASEYRRRGVGDALMEAVLSWAWSYGVTRVHLEVRESNEAALALYEKYSFTRVGRRKEYYILPVEDAISMELRANKC